MSTQFSSIVENMLASFEKTAQLASEYGNEEHTQFDVYKSMVRETCELELHHKHIMGALDNSKDKGNIKEFEMAYQANLQSEATNVANTTRYKTCIGNIRQNLVSSSGEANLPGTIQIGDVEFDDFIPDTDPITRRPMTRPVKNKKCGHYYEKSSIMEALKIKRQLRCPVPGCANTTYISPVCLVDDPAFAKLLKDRQKVQEDSD